jgi:hypothetical protein
VTLIAWANFVSWTKIGRSALFPLARGENHCES